MFEHDTGYGDFDQGGLPPEVVDDSLPLNKQSCGCRSGRTCGLKKVANYLEDVKLVFAYPKRIDPRTLSQMIRDFEQVSLLPFLFIVFYTSC